MVDPTNAVESITNSGVLGAITIILLFVSYKLLNLLLQTKDERIDDKASMLEKYSEIQTATKALLKEVLDEVRKK